MEKFRAFGTTEKGESQREKEHKLLARKVAREGMVLLKNDGVLPIKVGKIALYGPGSRMTVKGGAGSGDVKERHSVTIEEGLRSSGFSFSTLWMDRFEAKYKAALAEWRAGIDEAIKGYSPIRTMDMFIKIGETPRPKPVCTPVLADELTDDTDTAIYVLARQAGEGFDRRVEKGDYLLSDVEAESLKLLSSHYKKLILILNCGGPVDLSILDETRIDAVIFYAQGGMEGGNALAELLSGEATPCGKLTDTWAMNYYDYPSADTYSHINGETEFENYYEGIFVGYRYFESKSIKPRFPFGYGLSYTEFSHSVVDTGLDGEIFSIDAEVKNEGEKYSGKEVLQLYVRKPNGRLIKEKMSLVAFGKTGLLSPSESTKLSLSFNVRDMASFDENSHSFVLEAGNYGIFLGTSVDNANPVAKITVKDEIICERVNPIDAKLDFAEMKIESENENYPDALPSFVLTEKNILTVTHKSKEAQFDSKIESVARKLSVKDKANLCVGGGYKINCFNNVMGAAGRTCTALLKKGVPNIVLADGPAGLNVNQVSATGKEGFPRYPEGLPEDWKWGWLRKTERLLKAISKGAKNIYRYMTAWPSETLMAQTFDTSLVEDVGRAVGKEMLEIGVSVWLAPGLNIHRNPLCGRNFEYYSEDPLVSGKMAAAITRGVQSQGGVGVSIKHFLCNNQEENRMGVTENVSERAIREIYLRGFRIAVEESSPWTVMSSYNRVNGKYVCNDRRLLTDILRDEWGFSGLVMSDWNATEQCSYAEAINAGNDLIMPGTKAVHKKLLADIKAGRVDMNALELSAERVLRVVFNSDSCKGF